MSSYSKMAMATGLLGSWVHATGVEAEARKPLKSQITQIQQSFSNGKTLNIADHKELVGFETENEMVIPDLLRSPKLLCKELEQTYIRYRISTLL